DKVFFHPNGKLVTSVSDDGKAITWSIGENPAAPKVFTHRYRLEDVRFSPEGNYLASADKHGFVRLWDVANAAEIFSSKPESVVKRVVFSPNGRWLGAARLDGVAAVFQLPSGQIVRTLTHEDPEEGNGMVDNVAFSPDSQYLSSVSGQVAIVWEVDTGRKVS